MYRHKYRPGLFLAAALLFLLCACGGRRYHYIEIELADSAENTPAPMRFFTAAPEAAAPEPAAANREPARCAPEPSSTPKPKAPEPATTPPCILLPPPYAFPPPSLSPTPYPLFFHTAYPDISDAPPPVTPPPSSPAGSPGTAPVPPPSAAPQPETTPAPDPAELQMRAELESEDKRHADALDKIDRKYRQKLEAVQGYIENAEANPHPDDPEYIADLELKKKELEETKAKIKEEKAEENRRHERAVAEILGRYGK